MTDPDPKTWIEMARSYDRLRRLNRRFTLGYVGSFFVFGALFCVAAQARSLAPPAVLFLLFLVAWCPCWLGIIITELDLRGCRCPRCGGRVMGSWRLRWSFRGPPERCANCQLALGPAAMSADKPSSTADSWE